MIITNNIFISNYLDIDLSIPGLDPEEVKVNIEIEFKVEPSRFGIQMDVNEIKSVLWRYNGGDGQSDSSYTITYNKKKSDDLSFGLFVEHVTIDVANKTIQIDLES